MPSIIFLAFRRESKGSRHVERSRNISRKRCHGYGTAINHKEKTPMSNVSFSNFHEYYLDPVSFYMKNFDDDFEGMTIHYHAYLELMYVQSGSFLLYIINDETQELSEFKVVAGQFVVLNSFTKHRLVIEKGKPAFIYNVEFNPRKDFNPFGVNDIIRCNFHALFNQTEFRKISQEKTGFMIINDTQNVGQVFKDLLILTSNGVKNLEGACSLLLYEISLFNEIAKCLKTENFGTSGYVRKAKSFIFKNYQRPLSIDDVAEHVGKSRSYLQRQYKKQVGETIMETLNNLRIQKAATLIDNTNTPITQIATDVGFSNKNHLNYEFKKVYGLSPSEYKRLRGKNHIDHHYEYYYSVPIFSSAIKGDGKKNKKK